MGYAFALFVWVDAGPARQRGSAQAENLFPCVVRDSGRESAGDDCIQRDLRATAESRPARQKDRRDPKALVCRRLGIHPRTVAHVWRLPLEIAASRCAQIANSGFGSRISDVLQRVLCDRRKRRLLARMMVRDAICCGAPC